MAPGKYGNRKSLLRFTYTTDSCPWELNNVFSVLISLFDFEVQMPRGQKISCLLPTSFKILVANT